MRRKNGGESVLLAVGVVALAVRVLCFLFCGI